MKSSILALIVAGLGCLSVRAEAQPVSSEERTVAQALQAAHLDAAAKSFQATRGFIAQFKARPDDPPRHKRNQGVRPKRNQGVRPILYS